MSKLKLQLHADLGDFLKGRTIEVEATNGIPVDKYWRDRIKDSKIDGCVSIVKSTKKAIAKKQEMNNDHTIEP